VKLLALARALSASNPKYTQSAPDSTAARNCGHPPAGANTSGFSRRRRVRGGDVVGVVGVVSPRDFSDGCGW
tara:strand:- start:253 stop:468 length:216 start_codon:yes stop_codon:yes gene_type:complete